MTGTKRQSMKDYYGILGVAPNASADEVRQRYRFLVQAYHPDRFPDPANKTRAEEEFKLVQAAYRVLSNPRERAVYDQTRGRGQSADSTRRPQNRTGKADEAGPSPMRNDGPIGFSRQRFLGFSGAQWVVGALFLLNLVVRDPLPLWDELLLLVLFFTIDKLLLLFGR